MSTEYETKVILDFVLNLLKNKKTQSDNPEFLAQMDILINEIQAIRNGTL